MDLNRIGVDDDLGNGRVNEDVNDEEERHSEGGITREFQSGLVYENASGF